MISDYHMITELSRSFVLHYCVMNKLMRLQQHITSDTDHTSHGRLLGTISAIEHSGQQCFLNMKFSRKFLGIETLAKPVLRTFYFF